MKEVADGMLYKASISNIVCLFLRALGASIEQYLPRGRNWIHCMISSQF
jgi:hypothetical protein